MNPISDYFTKENYVTPHPNPAQWINHSNHIVMERFGYLLRGTVADLGCNHGACTQLLANYASKIIGVDLFVKTRPTVRTPCFVAGDIRVLPFADGSFDAITSFHVLEHIWPNDLKFVMHEIARVVRQSGHVVISVPNAGHYDSTSHVNRFSLNHPIPTFCLFHRVACYVDDRHCLITVLRRLAS